LPLPVTVAKNCMVFAPPLEGTMNAYKGATVTATGPASPVMVIVAAPLFDGSA